MLGGKSVFAEIMLIEYLLKKNTFNAYISPSFSQGRKVFKEITQLLDGKGIIKKANASTLSIETIYNSQLQFFSMESPTAIRGYTVSGILVMDEAAFFPDILSDGTEPWGSVIMPITKARKPKILVISTPRGKRGMFFDFYNQALLGTKGFAELTADIYSDELITKEQIEEIKSNVSDIAFKEEFLVEFLDSSLTFFNGFEKCFKTLQYNHNIKEYIGVDLSGDGTDSTILTKINVENEVMQFEIKGSLDSKYKQISDIINSSKTLQAVYIENNGLGTPMYNEIQKLTKKKSLLNTFTTTNNSKEEIISTLAVKIAKEDITFDKEDTKLFSEFSTFICKYTKTKKLQFEAMDGKHDDRIMSLAIANKCKDDFKYETILNFYNQPKRNIIR